MNNSETLKCAEEANQLVEEISRLINQMTNVKNNHDYAASITAHSLEEKLVKMKVYVDELVNELKWRDKVSKVWKREIDRVMYIAIGMILCGVWLHFIR